MSCSSRLVRFVALLALLLASATPRAQASGWELVFHDDFNGPAVDRQKWATRYIYNNEQCDTFPKNEEKQRYRDNQNHVFADGKLGLVARRVKPDGEYEFESGMLRSYQTFYYGYFEARVKAPSAVGTWPAFWLAVDRDADGYITWPPEIDIFDNANNGKDATSSSVYSGGVGEKTAGSPQGGELLYGDPKLDSNRVYWASRDLSADYHVYGLLWTPTQISLWLDGKLIYTKAYKWVGNDGKLAGPAHLLLNLAVGGPWAGRFGFDKAAFPQTFSVDYVRVCQLSDKKTAGRKCGPSHLTPDPVKYAYNTAGIGGDLRHPIVFDSVLSGEQVKVGSTLELTHKLKGQVATKEAHGLYEYLVNERGQTVHWRRLTLPVPTTKWAGQTVTVSSSLAIPAFFQPGKYRVFVSLGSPESWDQEGKVSLRSINLEYAPEAKQRERIGQPTRYKVGELEIVR
jgi:beta-glucanase (GH16 family)